MRHQSDRNVCSNHTRGRVNPIMAYMERLRPRFKLKVYEREEISRLVFHAMKVQGNLSTCILTLKAFK